MRRAVIVLVVTVAAVLVAAQPGWAGPGWLSTVPAFSDANTVPEVAMAPDGTLAAAYTVPTVRDLWLGGPLEVRIRPPGGEFGPPTVLASDASDLRLAFGRGGHVAVVWRSGSGHYVAVRPPGGVFGATHEVAPDGSFASIDQLAVAPDGRVWIAGTITSRSDVFTLGPEGGVRFLPLDTGPAFTAAAPGLAVDGDGRVTIVYRHTTYVPGAAFDSPCHVDYEIRVAEGGAGGFADVATLARATESGTMLTSCFEDGVELIAPELAMRSSGDAVVTYGLEQRVDPRAVATQIVARFRPTGGAWPDATSSPEPIITRPHRSIATPAFAGSTPLVLLEDTWEADVALAARSADGGWSDPQLLTPHPAEQALIAGSPSGNALIAYIDLATARATGVVHRPDGTLSAPEPLSSPFRGWVPLIAWLSIATDDDGNGVLTSGEPEHQAWLTPYDGAGPRITASFPAGGSIGQSLPFAATALDVWSGASIEWSFGDGETADGSDATHAYFGPGRFAAIAQAVDGVGNATMRSGTVAIPEPPDLTLPRFRGGGIVSPRRVRRGGAARVHFALSEPATVSATLTARLPGVRRGRRCVAPRPSTGARAAAVRCRRTVRQALRAKRFAEGGIHELTFKTRRLAPARYTLTLIAHDAAGNRSRALTLTLTVLPVHPHARRPQRAG